MTIVIRDEFQGTGNLTGHVPDLKPVGITAWTTKVASMLLDNAGGYAYGPGSANAATLSSGGYLGSPFVPQNHGFSSVGKITVGFRMGTSNAPVVSGFSANGVQLGVYINNEGWTTSLSGNSVDNAWTLSFPAAHPATSKLIVPTPTINTDYEFVVEYNETSFTLSWNGYSYTFPFTNTHISGLNAIDIGTASRTGGGVLWRYLQVEDFGGSTPVVVFTT